MVGLITAVASYLLLSFLSTVTYVLLRILQEQKHKRAMLSLLNNQRKDRIIKVVLKG